MLQDFVVKETILNKLQTLTFAYYDLVHLAKQEYYYCGLDLNDVQQKLYELGVNRKDG